MSTTAAISETIRGAGCVEWTGSIPPAGAGITADPRRFIEQRIALHPAVTVGAAIAAGVVLGWFIKRA
jgi:hypothetical protein